MLNEVVLRAFAFSLVQEFEDYIHQKDTVWLQRGGLIINKMKVYRLMRKVQLLLPKTPWLRSTKRRG